MNYKKLRKSAGLSLSEMAAYLAVDPRTVRRYEDGTRTPGGPVNKLYAALNAKPTSEAGEEKEHGNL